MAKESENGKINVRPVGRSCKGCHLRARAEEVGWICPLCTSLVRDETGRFWLYHKWLEDGNGYQVVKAGDLQPAPRFLLTE